VTASLFQIITFSIQTASPPFPVFCIVFAFNGAGLAIQGAQVTGLVASIRKHGSEKMGLLHAMYGKHRIESAGLTFVKYILNRFGSVRHATCLDPIRSTASLVFPFSHFSRIGLDQY
jgi:hypothetical protein